MTESVFFHFLASRAEESCPRISISSENILHRAVTYKGKYLLIVTSACQEPMPGRLHN